MGYRIQDVFPGALPAVTIDLASLVENIDASREAVVDYAFGAGSPDVVKIGDREIIGAQVTGSISPRSFGRADASRYFIEYAPPYSPGA